ncbi:hypothetical protein NAI42_12495, partial [Francisella tularensis subsp. holarctica]
IALRISKPHFVNTGTKNTDIPESIVHIPAKKAPIDFNANGAGHTFSVVLVLRHMQVAIIIRSIKNTIFISLHFNIIT